MSRLVDPNRWANKRHLPPWLGVVTVVVIVLLFSVISVGQLWFGESGSGETRESPDGRYTASAMNMSRGAINGTRVEWVEIRVSERDTGHEVWKVIRKPPTGTTPDYGMRDVKFVAWTADSSAVSVDLGSGPRMTFSVP